MTIEKLLRLNRMYEADKGGQGGGAGATDDNPDDNKGGSDGKGGQGDQKTGDEPGKKDKGADDKAKVEFTPEQQAVVNSIVEDRLARERKKQEDEKQRQYEESERQRLEENEEYKELAQKLQKQLDDQKGEATKAKKESMLSQAGYSEDQIDRYVKYLEGESDADIKESLEQLKEDIPPTQQQFADPSINNGGKNTPEKKDLKDEGKSMYQRLKGKGKIKGKK